MFSSPCHRTIAGRCRISAHVLLCVFLQLTCIRLITQKGSDLEKRSTFLRPRAARRNLWGIAQRQDRHDQCHAASWTYTRARGRQVPGHWAPEKRTARWSVKAFTALARQETSVDDSTEANLHDAGGAADPAEEDSGRRAS